MKNVYRFLNVFLCVCLTSYTLPVFASTPQLNSSDTVKISLSDSDMGNIMGANGSVDASLADYTVAGSKATAVFANRSTLGVKYSLDVVNSNGVVIENLATGNLGSDSAILVSGTPTNATNRYIQARVWNESLLGFESKDSSWAP
ncbi:MAG: hypothetical protein QM504_03150 [Pseudomonadota bacterium]